MDFMLGRARSAPTSMESEQVAQNRIEQEVFVAEASLSVETIKSMKSRKTGHERIKRAIRRRKMLHELNGRVVRTAMVLMVFVIGFLCGSVSHPRANAQLGQLGNEITQKAGASGGALGTAVQLGQTITQMQQNVDSLQKNIDVLKQVKTSLGG